MPKSTSAVIVLGRWYRNLDALHKELQPGVSVTHLRKLQKQGVNLSAVLSRKDLAQNVTIDGVTYPSLLLAHEGIGSNIDFRIVMQRVQSGVDAQVALTKPVVRRPRIPITIDGVQYPSVTEALRTLKPAVSRSTVMARLRRSVAPEDIFREENAPERSYREVVIDGVTFESIRKAYRELKPKYSYPMIVQRIREGMDPTEAFFKQPKRRGKRKARLGLSQRSFTIRGVCYANISDAYRKLQPPVSIQTIQFRIREGMSRSKAFSLPANSKGGDGVVYTITHSASGKIYVGETFSTLERKWKTHVYNAINRIGKEGDHPDSLQEAIRRDGADAFECKVVDQQKTKEALRTRKMSYIASLGSAVPRGYNLQSHC